jgi:WD40 repeat protein
VTSIAFSADSKYLASSSNDYTIKIWSTESQKEVKTLLGHLLTVWTIAFSPDGKYLASGSTDQTIKLWSIES